MESSNQGNREPTLKPSNLPASAATANSPMDFINKMSGQAPAAPVTPPTISNTPPQVVRNDIPNDPVINAASPVDPMRDILANIEAKKALKAEEDANQIPADFNDGSQDINLDETPAQAEEENTDDTELEVSAPELSEEEILSEDIDPKIVSVKKLRKTANEHKFKAETLQNELETTKAELEDYKTGKVVPETLHEYEARIQELEQYEQVHNLKKSKYWRQKVTEPLNQLGSQLGEHAAKYGVSEEIIHLALNAKNDRERDEILEDNFTTLAALEAKQLITKMGDIRQVAQEANENAVETLARFTREGEQIEEQQRQQKISKITTSSRNAWVNAHRNVVEKKLALELIPTDDPKFNAEVVQPLLKQASLEYTKVIKELAKLGIEDLPEELATGIALAFQLAHASGVAISSRDAAVNHLNTMEQNIKRTYSYERPRLGQSNVAVNGPGREAPIGGTRASAQQAAQQLITVGREIAKQMPK